MLRLRVRPAINWRAVLFAAVFFGGGLAAGHRIWAPGAEIAEKPATEVRQADGSVVAKRDPKASVKQPHQLPRASSPVRAVSVTVQPKRKDCSPVRVDLTLVQQADGHRIVASSPDGTVISALDVPLAMAQAQQQRKWAAGVSYEISRGRYGAWVERDYWRIRLGADVVQTRKDDVEARIRLGVTF